jgi:hypothetical protein
MWVVQPRHALARRILLPIYARDQLIFFAVLGSIVVLGAAFDPGLALYIGIGGYVGAMLTMEVTTPSWLLLPVQCHQRVVELLDGSQFLRRRGNGEEWINARGRLYRWESDTLRLHRVADGVSVTGSNRDLQIIAAQVRS